LVTLLQLLCLLLMPFLHGLVRLLVLDRLLRQVGSLLLLLLRQSLSLLLVTSPQLGLRAGTRRARDSRLILWPGRDAYVSAMRDAGKGWGEIGHELGVSPGIGWIMGHGHGNGGGNGKGHDKSKENGPAAGSSDAPGVTK